MRPFWIVSRHVAVRETCLCVTHQNMQFKFDNFKHLGIFSAPNLTELCIKGQEKEIRRTVKGQKTVTNKELVESFLEDLKMFLENNPP